MGSTRTINQPIAPTGDVPPPSTLRDADQIIEELNVLKLEGFIFCLNPKAANRSSGRLTVGELHKHPVVIEPHPNYGRPSSGAYKALQAVWLKLTQEGWPYPKKVSFSRRELEWLRGSRSVGGYQTARTYRDLMQLRMLVIHCARKDKETGDLIFGSLNLFQDALFSARDGNITSSTLTLSDEVHRSINNFHIARFNWYRLRDLEPIAAILFKRFFQWAAEQTNDATGKPTFKTLEKDYEAVCREWLGGLKPERYKSLILSNQLGRHLEAVQRTSLGRIEVAKRASGDGFKLVFTPRKGFFEDYGLLYGRNQLRLRFQETADRLTIEEPLQLVASFHRHLGRDQNRFEEKEVSYARHLLDTYAYAEIEDLIAYAVAEARKSGFDMLYFGALSRYLPAWDRERAEREARRRIRERITACPLCNEAGHVELRDLQSGQVVSMECPHEEAQILLVEERKGLRRA